MTTENATQPGAEEAEVAPVVVGNSDRMAFLDAIAESARKQRDEEIAAEGGTVVDTLNVEAPKEEEEAPAVEAEAKPEDPPRDDAGRFAKKEEAPVDDYVTVKVEGQERQVLRSQILDAGIRAVQKESAASLRLEEATRIKREAEQLMQFAQDIQRTQPSMDAAEIARNIRMGTDEEAAQAMGMVMGRETATPDQLAAAVEARVLDKIQARQAADAFQRDYADILESPYLVQLAANMDERMVKGGDARPYADRFKAIGEELRGFVRSMKGGKPDVVTSSEKQARKSNIVNLPAASIRQPAPETTAAKSPSQLVEEMRRKRGQS